MSKGVGSYSIPLMKRIPDMLISARRHGNDGMVAHMVNTADGKSATLYFEPEDGEPFDDEYFESAKEDIAEIIVTKFMADTGKPFNELDVVVGFHAPEFDNIEFDLVPPED